ncbi:tetratricopeptide repeat protein [Sulfurovum sp. bin170]|uniref:tetratricopeptide repeat protein n=1 Tax=Sulfurovum sp. bin170 TaxID=2695268 RepID=UPI0013DED596|nr:tetratricopeptide repeat protein [Sulfurovum sp. bin170]NEW60414.1 tetratricopeptide repeat protein [Sulfurovum sp. bin170]
MRKVSINRLLTRAEQQFSLGEYQSAMTTYGLLLKEFPTHSDAKIGAFLCDIGMESGEEAQALFDYYQIIKKEQDDAPEVMSNLISTLDSTKNQISDLLSPVEDKIEYEDGIGYKDFLQFVDDRGDFSKAFEDVMFSTKVILRGKEEYIDFVSKLIDKGEEKLAEQFLDSMSSAFGKSQDIYELYHKLKQN